MNSFHNSYPNSPCEGVIRSLVPDFVVVEEGQLVDVDDGLYAEELASIKDAVSRRRLEFATGRVFAHRALEKLGVLPQPLLEGSNGAPRWPIGITGSISHCQTYCAVATTRTTNCSALGIDIEKTGRISSEMIPHIATQREIEEILGTLEPFEMQRVATLLFSAKESLFKCRSQLGSPVQNMTEVEIELDIIAHSFQPLGPFAEKYKGLFSFSGDFVATVCLSL